VRIRSTKPEFWRSERIARVDWDARLVLKGLESYVDDNGVGRDDMALIVGDLFQRDLVREPSRTLARVSESLSALNREGLLWRYEFEGTDLLYMAFWDSIQRIDKPNPGRFPRPDGTLGYKESVIRESVATTREGSRILAPVTGEQGNRGTGEQRNSSSPAVMESDSSELDSAFDEAYSHWPKKVEKKAALEKFKAAAKRIGADKLTADIIRFGDAYAATTTKKFTPGLNVWIGHERWTDELPTPDEPAPKQLTTKADQNAALFHELYGSEETNERTRSISASDPGIG